MTSVGGFNQCCYTAVLFGLYKPHYMTKRAYRNVVHEDNNENFLHFPCYKPRNVWLLLKVTLTRQLEFLRRLLKIQGMEHLRLKPRGRTKQGSREASIGTVRIGTVRPFACRQRCQQWIRDIDYEDVWRSWSVTSPRDMTPWWRSRWRHEVLADQWRRQELSFGAMAHGPEGRQSLSGVQRQSPVRECGDKVS